MARRLKVFCWSDGLKVYTVATTSRAKALAAWGFHRDLFRDGEAREIASGQDYKAALARPGETIRRALDSAAVIPTASKRPGRTEQRRAAERARLERLGQSIAALAEEQRTGEAEIARERQALAEKQARLAQRLQARRDALERERKEVRTRRGTA